MFENPRRVRQARNFTKNLPKILDLKSVSEKLTLGAPDLTDEKCVIFASGLFIPAGSNFIVTCKGDSMFNSI